MADEVKPWDVLALASFAPLGAFPSVRLSPNLSPGDLGVAGTLAIPRGPGEFLVGAITGGSGADSVPVLLTTHRIIWFERGEPAPGAVDRRPTLSGRAADFLDVDPETAAVGDSVDLGRGRVVPLPHGGPELAETLAEALRTMHLAASTGEAPAIDPGLAARIVAVVPKARELDARLGDVGVQRARFRDDLLGAEPRVVVTPALIAACVATWGAMVVAGVSPLEPNTDELMAWGANNAIRIALKGEAWRLPASVFLHGGVIHLAVNMWALSALGPLVERFYGPLRFATLYLAAGVGGALASMATPPVRDSVGASGAIFGVLAAILSFLLVHRRTIPSSVLKPLWRQALGFVGFNVAFGLAVPAIDQAAHLGGLAIGFVVGLAIAPSWPRRGSTAAATARSILASAGVAVVLAVVCVGVVRWRATTITPTDLFRDFVVQVSPSQSRRDESLQEVLALVGRSQDRDERERRAEAVERLSVLVRASRSDLAKLGAVWTPDPTLRKAAGLVVDAQRRQVEALEAAVRYARTGDRRELEGEDGLVGRVQEADGFRRSADLLAEEYLRKHGLDGRRRGFDDR